MPEMGKNRTGNMPPYKPYFGIQESETRDFPGHYGTIFGPGDVMGMSGISHFSRSGKLFRMKSLQVVSDKICYVNKLCRILYGATMANRKGLWQEGAKG